MTIQEILERLALLDAQEDSLHKERKRYMGMLIAAQVIPAKSGLSKSQIAEALNRRDLTILRRKLPGR